MSGGDCAARRLISRMRGRWSDGKRLMDTLRAPFVSLAVKGKIERIMREVPRLEDQLEATLALDPPGPMGGLAAAQLLDAAGVLYCAEQTLGQQAVSVRRVLERLEWFAWVIEQKVRPIEGGERAAGEALAAVLDAFGKLRLELPPGLLAVEVGELAGLPLAATAPGADPGRPSVQRVLGALVVAQRSEETLEPFMAHYLERRTTETALLAPRIMADVDQYDRAFEEALQAPGGLEARAEIGRLAAAVSQSRPRDLALSPPPVSPQPVAPARAPSWLTDADEDEPAADASVLQLGGRVLRSNSLEFVTFTRLHGSHASCELYRLVSSEVSQLGIPGAQVLVGMVKKEARMLFKAALKYGCDFSRVLDVNRCTVQVETLAEARSVLEQLLASPHLSTLRCKNRFQADYATMPIGGYRDLQLQVGFIMDDDEMLGEVQINLKEFVRIKSQPDGGHAIFDYARSILAFDPCTFEYLGEVDERACAMISGGTVVRLSLEGGCVGVDAAKILGGALASPACRVAALDLGFNNFGLAELTLLAPGLALLDHLEELNLSGAELMANDAASLALVVGSLHGLRRLRTLQLGRCGLGARGASMLVPLLLEMPWITRLDLRRNGLDDAAAIALAEGLPALRGCVGLDLSKNEIGSAGMRALASTLGLLEKLQVLHLGMNAAGPDGAEALAGALRSLRALRDLNLWDNKLGVLGMLVLAPAIARLTELVELKVEDNQFLAGGAGALASSLLLLANLRVLDLRCCVIGDDGATAIAAVLNRVPKLKRLNLQFNNIRLPGAVALAAGLPNLRGLEILSLENNWFGDEGGAALAPGLCSLRLREVNLIGCGITDDAPAVRAAVGSCCTVKLLDRVCRTASGNV